MMMATSLLRAGVRENSQQTAQDAWGKVNQFLNIEVGEATRFYLPNNPDPLEPTELDPIEEVQTISDCAGATLTAGSESFKIRVPSPAGGGVFRQIFYYTSGTDLMRCGPPVLANGTLDFSAPSAEAVLSYNTTLRVVSLGHNDRSVQYTLDFRSPYAGVEFTGVGRAWAQSSIIQLEQ
jgi:hypothetical protein